MLEWESHQHQDAGGGGVRKGGGGGVNNCCTSGQAGPEGVGNLLGVVGQEGGLPQVHGDETRVHVAQESQLNGQPVEVLDVCIV